MKGVAYMTLLADRIRAHALVLAHTVPVYTEAEEADLEAVLVQELAKGGLHIVLALGEAKRSSGGSRNGIRVVREVVVSLAYIPGLTPPPLPPVELAEALAGWLHGWPLPGAVSPVWCEVEREAPLPDGADVSGRQLTLVFSDFVEAAE